MKKDSSVIDKMISIYKDSSQSFSSKVVKDVLILTGHKKEYQSAGYKKKMKKLIRQKKISRYLSENGNYHSRNIVTVGNGVFESRSGYELFLPEPGKKSGKLIIFIHGGGYVSEATVFHRGFCARLCRALSAPVFIPKYGLAPFHNIDDALSEVEKKYNSAVRHFSPRSVILMGDSAGGGLALSLCLYRKKKGQTLPHKLVLISPWVDVTMSNPEINAIEDSDPLLSRYGLKVDGEIFSQPHDPNEPLISPVNGDLQGLPPMLVICGTNEIIYPDIKRFCKKAFDAGCEIRFHSQDGMIHDFPIYPVKEAAAAFKAITGFVCED
ncbi:MAG: alpha/beta hydrolase [Oscillospiraceae bacterium]|nr:alpha/beta hydrolase [Oscillospiraceae bacterium]